MLHAVQNPLNFLDEKLLRTLASKYTVDCSSLNAELLIASRMLKGETIQGITGVLTKLKPAKQVFTTQCIILEQALTFPVSNTKCERSFSVLTL